MNKKSIAIGLWVIIALIIGVLFLTEKVEYRKTYVNDNTSRLIDYALSKDGKIRTHILIHADEYGNGARLVSDRQGYYTVNEEHTFITCKFNDGMPPYKLTLKQKGKRMTLIDEDGLLFTEDPYLYK